MDPTTWSHFLQTGNVADIENVCKHDNLAFIAQSFGRSNTSFTRTNIPATTMAIQATQQSIVRCVEEPDSFTQNDSFAVESSTSEHVIPRRNLTEAFDELYVEIGVAETPTSSKATQVMFTSPHGVIEVGNLDPSMHDYDDESALPTFSLHPALKRDLSQALVNRVSFYGIIHDINKEAVAMATNDQYNFDRVNSTDEADDGLSPLVIAVNGPPAALPAKGSSVEACLIDEECWLLSAIEGRGDEECRSISSCPPTFSQAMGERDYDDTSSTLEASRTQLWKPSRSWWEAKSGRNPWIEPKSHNKRWRYLWPLIHYHKFLAKCVKKLKRNAVDVKVSVSPVAVFLREEVCSVSDHLATVSHFGSEEWMSCLESFNGWIDIDERTEARIRAIILRMKLRPLTEPGDVDSPLLRSQIDEQFLRSMVALREQMSSSSSPRPTKPPTRIASKKTHSQASTAQVTSTTSSRPGLPLHPKSRHLVAPPGFSSSHKYSRPPKPSARSRPIIANSPSSTDAVSTLNVEGVQLASYNKYGYYWHGWTPQYALCDDGTSVESALSGDSHMHQQAVHDSGIYAHQHGFYHCPSQASHTPDPSLSNSENGSFNNSGSYDGSFYPMPGQYHVYPNMGNTGWYPHMGDPNITSVPLQMERGPLPSAPASPQVPHSPRENGQHYSPHVPNSPYWSHLDYNTLAISGIMTPQSKIPSTPSHRLLHGEKANEEEKKESSHTEVIQRSHHCDQVQYYPPPIFGGAREGYAYPSPATQFMMSPQANSQAAAYYAYNYPTHYYMSPHRHSTQRSSPQEQPSRQGNKSKEDEELLKVEDNKTRRADLRKSPQLGGRASPATVATIAESESVSGE